MPTTTRLLSIDLLRAAAALGVFFFHASNFAGFSKFRLPIAIPFVGATYSIPNFFSLGATGVSLFFVLSGYCLCRSWFLSPPKKFPYRSYYLRRFARIYPAYLFSLFFALPILTFKRGSHALLNATDDSPALLLDFAVHVPFLQGFSNQFLLSFNGTLWSMATEVQFYAVLPLLYVVGLRNRTTRTVLLLGISCLAIRYIVAILPALQDAGGKGVATSVLISYGLPGRISEFAIGALIAQKESRDRLPHVSALATVGLLILAALTQLLHINWLTAPCWGVSYGALLIWCRRAVDGRKWKERTPSHISAAQRFGIYSYSFFLIHQPILQLFNALHWLDSVGLWFRFVAHGTAAFIGGLIVAKWMFHQLEEKAMRKILALAKKS